MLSVELLNVLHRLLLTRDSLASHLVIMSTVAHVVRGSKGVLERKRAEKGITAYESLGESEIEPGKSVVFGALETCMCLLTRYFPSLIANSEVETSQPSPRLSAHKKGKWCSLNQMTLSPLHAVTVRATYRREGKNSP